jgi:dTDP-4-amino-4,6-dideoxygalactose transaminase
MTNDKLRTTVLSDYDPRTTNNEQRTTTSTMKKIPFARPWMDEREADAARRVILSGWVTQGPEVAAFERELAEAVRAPYACAVSSCTTALHLALLAVGVAPGDDVVTVSHSFIATANSIGYCGARPVFVDVDRDTFNIDPSRVEAAITPRTRALLVVHQVGMPCNLDALLTIAARRNLPVIEDAACAIGSEVRHKGRWEPIGAPRGDIACFSFHPRKLVSTGDGGMLTTRNAEFDARFRLLRQHGMSVPDTVRHASTTVVAESYAIPGFNYRLTDIQAAVGREQLKRLPALVSRRRELAARYQELLVDLPGVIRPFEPEWARTNWQTYTIRIAGPLAPRAIMQQMLDGGIATRRGVMNAHREPAWPKGTWSCGPEHDTCTCPGSGCGWLRAGEEIQDTAIALPLFHQMTDDDQGRVVTALRAACTQTV